MTITAVRRGRRWGLEFGLVFKEEKVLEEEVKGFLLYLGEVVEANLIRKMWMITGRKPVVEVVESSPVVEGLVVIGSSAVVPDKK